MALARVTYTQSVSGNRNFSVPFPYLSRDHVQVTVNGAAVTFSWLSASSIQTTTAPAIGAKVEVRRVTERNSLLVDFADGSTLTESQLDLASKQNFYLSQEADDLAVESNGLAKAATDTANAATATANEAKTLATTAVSTANTANSTANTADSKATSAVNTATNANNTANQALSKANNAETVAGSANTKADSAVSTANTASGTANSASTLANNAKTQAERAEAAANTATNTANQALANSASAVSLANSASIRADSAEAAAKTASESAVSAGAGAQAASALAANLLNTVNQVLEDVQSIAGGNLTDFSKNSENLSALTDKATARQNLGLGNVDNTSDADKPISTAVQQALNGKANTSHTHTHTQITGLGTAATANIQTGANDQTSGRVLINGAHGLGVPATSDSPNWPNTSLDNCAGAAQGFYRTLGIVTEGYPAGFSTACTLLFQIRQSGGTSNLGFTQTLIDTANNRIAFRTSIVSASTTMATLQWRPWRELYHAGNQLALGTTAAAARAALELGNVDNTRDADKPVSTAMQEALNGKANTSHTHTWDQVTGKPTTYAPSSHTHVAADIAAAFNATGLQSLGTDGYQRLPGGLILQWGRTVSISGDAATVISFPITFPSVVAVAHATPHVSGNATNIDNWGMVEPISTSQLRVYRGLNGANQNNIVYWTAIGY
ncbi:phage tail fiber protein [Pseudomonas aeruginosa]